MSRREGPAKVCLPSWCSPQASRCWSWFRRWVRGKATAGARSTADGRRLPRPEAAGRQAGRRSAGADDAGREGRAARRRSTGTRTSWTTPRRTSCRRRRPKKLMPRRDRRDHAARRIATTPRARSPSPTRSRSSWSRRRASGSRRSCTKRRCTASWRRGGTSFPQAIGAGGHLRSRARRADLHGGGARRRAPAACSTCWRRSSTSRAIRAGGASRRPTARIRTWCRRMGVAAVRGFQGRQAAGAPIDAQHVLATAKHFTAPRDARGRTQHGARQLLDARRSARSSCRRSRRPCARRTWRAVMASYNEVDGIPSHANQLAADGRPARRMGVPGPRRLRLLRHRRARAQAPRGGDAAARRGARRWRRASISRCRRSKGSPRWPPT